MKAAWCGGYARAPARRHFECIAVPLACRPSQPLARAPERSRPSAVAAGHGPPRCPCSAVGSRWRCAVLGESFRQRAIRRAAMRSADVQRSCWQQVPLQRAKLAGPRCAGRHGASPAGGREAQPPGASDVQEELLRGGEGGTSRSEVHACEVQGTHAHTSMNSCSQICTQAPS